MARLFHWQVTIGLKRTYCLNPVPLITSNIIASLFCKNVTGYQANLTVVHLESEVFGTQHFPNKDIIYIFSQCIKILIHFRNIKETSTN